MTTLNQYNMDIRCGLFHSIKLSSTFVELLYSESGRVEEGELIVPENIKKAFWSELDTMCESIFYKNYSIDEQNELIIDNLEMNMNAYKQVEWKKTE
jgi:hypothetical protein|tara:strand:- start:188 stop:478 length:291 start_codon:yes stop_codon:yes gene_type:complete